MGVINKRLIDCCCSGSRRNTTPKVEIKDLNRKSTFRDEPFQDRKNLNKKIALTKEIDIKAGDLVVKRQTNPQTFYELIKELGEGAFGRVIKVRHRKTNEFRAMKIISKKCLADGVDASEIENEINILKSLDHPHVIKVYEYYEYKENLYIVNELCEDGDLFQKIKALGLFKESLALKVIQQVIAAVKYLHSENICHGDLKPENILIDNYSKVHINNNGYYSDLNSFDVKLIDFGTSRIFDRLKVFDNLVGTSYYVAPEVINKSYHRQCDLWSCGVILYVLLSGTFPFNGIDDEEIFDQIKNSSVNFKLPAFKQVSSEAKDLISSLLNKNPIARLTAGEALDHKAFARLVRDKREIAKLMRRESSQRTLMKMQNVKNEHKFHQAITTMITHNFISKDQATKYRKMFKAMDKDKDGRLSCQEILDGYKEAGIDCSESTIKSMIANIDKDNNGYIEMEEFISASIDKEKLLSEENLKLAFDNMDYDSSGTISLDEVGLFIGGGTIDKEVLKQVVHEVNKDITEDISFDVFVEIMRKLNY